MGRFGVPWRRVFFPFLFFFFFCCFSAPPGRLKALSDEDAAAVTHLFIQRNEITKIPSRVSRLKNLRILDASHNQIDSVASELGQLGDLHTIYLQGNRLTGVPRALSQLKNLDVLWLEENEGLGDKARNLGKPFHEDRQGVLELFK